MIRRTAVLLSLILAITVTAADDPYVRTAEGAAKWIDASAVRTKDGIVWPSDPNDPKTVNTTLYSGAPGPILFFLELYRTTGESHYLDSARGGADALVASIATAREAGLYEGVAGTGFTLGQVYLVTHDAKYRDAALQCVAWLKEHAQRSGAGAQWNDTTDIIAGSSGTGLFLVWAAHELNAPGAIDLAAAAGRRLIEQGQAQAPDGLKWMMDKTFPNEMPNFSHGTAGVAYFLATLYQETHDRTFLDAALAGARYLLSVADTDGDACIIYHDSSAAGKGIYYLGWCHGPAGTARLFYRLYQATHDPKWMEWTKKSARALLTRGGPIKAVTPGEWDNVGGCCGVVAEAQFFRGLYRVTHDASYLEASKQATEYVLSKATRDERGVRWVQAEHRVKPELRLAQTGYMQGASGIGMWLLYADAARRQKTTIVLPDDPFSY